MSKWTTRFIEYALVLWLLYLIAAVIYRVHW
jgi:hypothetical protein